MQGNYSVRIESFAESHFIKSFQKKHKKHWDVTLISIIKALEHIDNLLLTSRAETIHDVDGVKIIKVEFTVSGTREAAKKSGNRCIVAWHKDEGFVSVLLVYSKTDIGSDNETVKWEALVKENYPEYKKYL